MNGFEGSFLGDRQRIDARTRLECGVCWWVYDPAIGDAVWQVPAGTAFAELPDHWRCPNCDAAPGQFMVIARGRPPREDAPAASSAGVALERSREQMLAAYGRVAGRMRALPVYRRELPLGLIGPRRCEQGLLTLLYSPWCMNLVLVAADTGDRVEGSEREIDFPSGRYPFTRGYLDGFGPIESCSLFSPMDDFADAAAVEAVAAEIPGALFAAATA